ncbi:MAG: tRNA pseudouridine(54/55) synthase Pus10 [Planctomycetota bacterium]
MIHPRSSQEPVRVLFEGRYCKLVRDLPQTIFYCPKCKGKGCARCEGYGKLTRDSVQELIARVAMPRLRGRRNKFHGAGREDVDVRMLGEGRPFVFEILKAKRPLVDLPELAEEINRRSEGRIRVHGLQYCGRRRVVEIKETRCPKDYQARIEIVEESGPREVEQRLQAVRQRGRITLLQATPRRVAHRRADLERKRWLELIDFQKVERAGGREGWDVTLRSAHGTYIKEAISGEEGRTKPSFSDLLGIRCRCVQLDVMAILPPEPEEAVSPSSKE